MWPNVESFSLLLDEHSFLRTEAANRLPHKPCTYRVVTMRNFCAWYLYAVKLLPTVWCVMYRTHSAFVLERKREGFETRSPLGLHKLGQLQIFERKRTHV